MHLAVFEDTPLTDLNTLRLPARAKRYAEIHSAEQLLKLVRRGDLDGHRVVVLGGGSNVVLRGDLDAFVLHIRIPGHALVSELDDAWIVRAGAGVSWHEFVRFTLDQGWPGLENLSLIPGTVGAAPIQNIGAYGVELSERFFALEAVDLRSGQIVSLDKKICQFAYRDSLFKQQAAGRFIITAVSFRLPKQWYAVTDYADVANELKLHGLSEPTAMEVSDAIVNIRRRKLPDPALLPNVGSFFKNPVVSAERFAELTVTWPKLPHHPQNDGSIKLAAGWLIEQAGWRGRNIGPVGMYEKQALVLVNHGGATGEDVLRLADNVCAAVLEKFGVALEQEPVLL
ncbi:MAG: UDP-N-acetylenolpyruvoylglucosamine reductase [Rhodocyclales bacterium]|nr:UDP-N-acetylenolpyruvoylglucosamine reductase [Rhodocyclales bacterium]MDB5888763.1 UDP-N-acetylenolpyruvoylglucosamine reductase [Rhodocyclales bacterium]